MRLQIKQLRKLIREEIEHVGYNRTMETKITQSELVTKFNRTKYATAIPLENEQVTTQGALQFHNNNCCCVQVTVNSDLSCDAAITRICKTLSSLGFKNVSSTRYELIYGNKHNQIMYFEKSGKAFNLIITL